MNLILITNNEFLAYQANTHGIERIMIDLEKNGKHLRQAGKNLFLSDHKMNDISLIKKQLTQSSLFVRVNSLYNNSKAEIKEVIDRGADYIMLPFFHQVSEVEKFCNYVGNNTKKVLLIETQEAVNNIREIAKIDEIDEFHIGLNDLCISMNYRSIFQPLYNGLIEECCNILKDTGKPYGFGGIGKLSATNLPIHPEYILAEQIRLGCSIGWLGRSFRGNNISSFYNYNDFSNEIALIRDSIAKWKRASLADFNKNSILLYQDIKIWESNKREDIFH